MTDWGFSMSYQVQNVAADDEGAKKISLHQLAGTYADTIHASFFV